ncbi:MAG: flippase-like domain-containing protein [Clostridia bacterium]|nr:flippase-like domain-containing protein [Clostridia bacterium]
MKKKEKESFSIEELENVSLEETQIIDIHGKKQKNPMNGKKVALFVLYGIIGALLLVTVLSFNDFPSIIDQLKTVRIEFVLLAILMVLIYLAIYPLSLCILAKARRTEVKFRTTYAIAMTEHFFNGITPLSTGGQPFQAYSFSRAKVKISESTGLLLANLLIYMAVTTGFSLTGLFFAETLFDQIDITWKIIIIIGYILNLVMFVSTLVLGLSKTVRNLLVKIVYFLCNFKIFKFLRPKAESLKEYFENVQQAFKDLMSKKGHFFLALLTKIISFAFLYSASFFIFLSLNVNAGAEHLLLSIAGTSFAITAVGFIPTPGASGAAEGSSGKIFTSIIVFIAGTTTGAIATANGVMLVWRLLSYYMVMLISLCFYIGLEICLTKAKKKREIARETKRALQMAQKEEEPPEENITIE